MKDKHYRKRLGAQKFEYNGTHLSVDKIIQQITIYLRENQSMLIIQSATLSPFFI